ncbi:hypothetical protein C1646_776082 [Rhizophagus diaphanus]|nr:hypothetical protein C1646_776082 [Rhizophagus diaphanus] [Rhizophagus sp. MUCL 43196]
MSSQASTPSSPSSITEEISSRTMLDVKIAGSDFLELTEEKFCSIGFALGPATRLTKFIKDLSQKLQNYFSLKTLNNLKEMLRRNKVNREDITNIKQFTPGM